MHDYYAVAFDTKSFTKSQAESWLKKNKLGLGLFTPKKLGTDLIYYLKSIDPNKSYKAIYKDDTNNKIKVVVQDGGMGSKKKSKKSKKKEHGDAKKKTKNGTKKGTKSKKKSKSKTIKKSQILHEPTPAAAPIKTIVIEPEPRVIRTPCGMAIEKEAMIIRKEGGMGSKKKKKGTKSKKKGTKSKGTRKGTSKMKMTMNTGPRGGVTALHGLIFNKDMYTVSQSKKWLDEHNIKPIKRVHVKKNTLWYRLTPINKDYKYRIKEFAPGIEAIYEIHVMA